MTHPADTPATQGEAKMPETETNSPKKITPTAAYILAAAVGLCLVGEAIIRYTGILGTPYQDPGSAAAAQQFVRDNFADVALAGAPEIAGILTVRVFARFAREECDVYLRADPDAPNGYGWVIKRIDCDYPGQVHGTPDVTTILATNP